MIFAVFDVLLNACRRERVYKLQFCTFIIIIIMRGTNLDAVMSE